MNIKDIAKKADVSVATISRYFHPEKRRLIRPKTQKKIQKIIKKYNYVPSRTAQMFSTGHTNTVGMVTPLSAAIVKSPFYQNLIAGIIEGGSGQYDLKWITLDHEKRQKYGLKDIIRNYSVDGLLVINWRILPNVVKEVERGVKGPVVLVNNLYSKVKSSIVYCENENGVKNVCDYLARKGYENVGMIQGPKLCNDANERFRLFKRYAPMYGLSLKKRNVRYCPYYDENAACEVMAKWIKEGNLPHAIFCANDDIALGAVRALKSGNIRIPDDVAVVGYDDAWADHAYKLTSVRQPLEEMGKAAIETLEKLISGKDKKIVRKKFESELVIRETA